MKQTFFIIALFLISAVFSGAQSSGKCKIENKERRFEIKADKTTVLPLSPIEGAPNQDHHKIICENAEITIYTEKGKIILKAKKFVYTSKGKLLEGEDASVETLSGEIIGQGKHVRLSLDKPYAIKIE